MFVCLIAFSCIEDYYAELKPADSYLLVVDGMITNLPGPHCVRLSLSTKLSIPDYIPVDGYFR